MFRNTKAVIFIVFIHVMLLTSCVPKVKIPEASKEVKEPSADIKAKEAWELQWQKILVKAQREGRVVIYGPPIAEARRGVSEGFQKAYPGIKVEYTALAGAQASPKIEAERRAGIYMVDLYIGGTSTVLTTGLRQFVVPIKPFLIHPEVINPEVWREGRLDFSDDDNELNLTFTVAALALVIYNSNIVDAVKIKSISYWEFTRPEWKGKIIIRDPRVVGSGQALATFWYLHPELGIEFIKRLAANEVIISRDARFITEAVARGKYSIGMSPDFASAIEMQKEGMPLQWLEDMKEGTHVGSSFGAVSFIDKAPHPNAASIFLNWLLGKEGQTIWSKASGYASRRLDVPTEHVMPQVLLKTGGKYLFRSDTENVVRRREEIVPQLNKIFSGF